MKGSREYLEEALALMGDVSDSEKARRLKIAQPTISHYRAGDRKMDDFACIMVARVLGIDPMRIIAASQEEREKNEERREFWRDFRNTLGTWAAATLAIFMVLVLTTPQAQAMELHLRQNLANGEYAKCLLCQIQDKIRRFFRSLVQIFCLCHLQHTRHEANA